MTKGYYGTSINTHEHGGTPDDLMKSIVEEFGEVYDPCPNGFTKDGLTVDWLSKNLPVYVNPPYTRGKISQWAEKCFIEYQRGCTVILLIPAYTDTQYFHDYIYPYAELRFLKGRLKFKGYTQKASFPSMLCIFRSHDLINPTG